MNYVDSVEILGFWGRKSVRIKFREDLNFLIGPNGSGKTTIINLISSVLLADIRYLYAVQFEKVTIRLKAIGANKKPIIEVTKTLDPKMGSVELLFTIREKTGDKGRTYGVEGPFDQRLYQDVRHSRSSLRHYENEGARLGSIMSDLVEVNWLSIHRSNKERDRWVHAEETFESSVDQKLRAITRAFSQYFSLLASRAEVESKTFQEYVFLSLLDQGESGADVFAQIDREPEEKSAVVGVLRDLKVSTNKATRSVNAHFARLQRAKKMFAENGVVDIDGAIALSDAKRISEMINEWRALQESRQSIFKPRIKFEKILNSLFSGKELHFDERNIPLVHFETGDPEEVSVLSSGEKQLFILLGEALLQEERPVVFISDEPELSLHVSWQNSLFKNIRSLNGKCQVISATHSPDIVGPFQDRVIKVEHCISDV